MEELTWSSGEVAGSGARRESGRRGALCGLLLGAYALSFALPLDWRVSMALLVAAALVAALRPSGIHLRPGSPYFAALGFALATLAAMPTSIDFARSASFASPLLPGALLATTLVLAPLGVREIRGALPLARSSRARTRRMGPHPRAERSRHGSTGQLVMHEERLTDGDRDR